METDKNNKSGGNTHMGRVIPPLAFIAAICLLVICCYESGYGSLPPTEKRYAAAKAEISSLKQNSEKNRLREPWEKLAAEFTSIYDADPDWPNRPAALFRAAEATEELARRSFSKSDARKAINVYENLALRHATSRLADDALFRAASMRAAWLKDDKGALALLQRIRKQYPKGDMVSEAIALERALRASANGKTSPDALKLATGAKKEIQEEQPAKLTRATAGGDIPLRFRAARTRMAALRKDPVKSAWRQPWEEIRDEFLRLNKGGRNDLAPAALFYAASAQQALAERSKLAADAKKAQEIYLSLPGKYPRSAYADDSLLHAAMLMQKSNQKTALKLLDRIVGEYPRGDMVSEARRVRSLWSSQGKTAIAARAPEKTAKKSAREAPEVQVLSWDSINKNSVRIVLETSAPAAYSTKLLEKGNGKSARLILDLEEASVVSDIRKGVTVQGSLLQAVRVREKKNGGASLQFDFRDVRQFDAHSEDDPCRIVLSVVAGKSALPKRSPARNAVASSAPKGRNRLNARQVSNMASQLGLTVQRVFIDPGHGGKDPGTSHNKVIERAITLDVAITLGRLLEANGLEVVFSRTKDRAVALSERVAMANAAKADLFISVHVNAHDNATVSGFETYYLDLASNSQAARVAMLENAASDRRLSDMQSMLADVMLNARVDESRRLALDIQRLSLFRLKKRSYNPRDNGVKSAPFHVLLGARMPAVLVELGYCSNSQEARNLSTPRYRHALAEGLAEGILAYKNRLLKNRTAQNSLTEKSADAM